MKLIKTLKNHNLPHEVIMGKAHQFMEEQGNLTKALANIGNSGVGELDFGLEDKDYNKYILLAVMFDMTMNTHRATTTVLSEMKHLGVIL